MNKDDLIKELYELVSKGELKPTLEKIIAYFNASDTLSTEETQVNSMVLNDLSRLATANNKNRLGILSNEDFEQEINKIRWNTIQTIQALESGNFNTALETKLPNPVPTQQKDKDSLDKIFKSLLLSLFVISIVILLRSVLMSGEFQERVLQMSISFLGGSGAGMGYFRWRLLEIKQ